MHAACCGLHSASFYFFVPRCHFSEFIRSMSVALVVKFCVVTNVLHDEGSTPNKSNLCSFGSISTSEVRQSSNLRFQEVLGGGGGGSLGHILCFRVLMRRLLNHFSWVDFLEEEPAL